MSKNSPALCYEYSYSAGYSEFCVVGDIAKYFGCVVILHAEWPHVSILDCKTRCHGSVNAE